MRFLCLFFLVFAEQSFSMTFSDAVKKIKNHKKVQVLQLESERLKALASLKGAWDDPVLKLALKNLPQESLAKDESAMSGTEIAIEQKIPLSPYKSRSKEAYRFMASGKSWSAKGKQDQMIGHLWMMLIKIRGMKEELVILKDNLTWVKKMLNVAQRLYTKGRKSQQGVLDLKIRRTELVNQIDNKTLDLEEAYHHIHYSVGSSNAILIEDKTIPWVIFTRNGAQLDKRYKELQAMAKGQKLQASAKSWSRAPDIKLSLAYTKKEFEGLDDQVSMGVSVPLPLFSKSRDDYRAARLQAQKAQLDLEDYEIDKAARNHELELAISKINSELKSIENESIRYAENSRQITAKSYEIGDASYAELLQAELRLQKLKLRRIMLRTKFLNQSLKKKLLNGEPLYES